MRRVAVGMTTVNNVVYSIVVVFYGANEIGVPLLCFYYFYLNEVNGVNTDPLFPYMNNKFFLSLSLKHFQNREGLPNYCDSKLRCWKSWRVTTATAWNYDRVTLKSQSGRPLQHRSCVALPPWSKLLSLSRLKKNFYFGLHTRDRIGLFFIIIFISKCLG